MSSIGGTGDDSILFGLTGLVCTAPFAVMRSLHFARVVLSNRCLRERRQNSRVGSFLRKSLVQATSSHATWFGERGRDNYGESGRMGHTHACFKRLSRL